MIYTAGNKGEQIRSDCWVELEILDQGGIELTIQSKVKSLYGQSIEELCLSVLSFFEIKHARLLVDDKGALPFVMASRIESAIKQFINADKEFLLPSLPSNNYSTARDCQRFSRLYIPGNNPKLMINAGIYGSGGIILDLEDSVAPEKKSEARMLVRNALRTIEFRGSERMVRINQLPAGLEDLKMIVPQFPNLILLPKCESAEQVKQVDEAIGKFSNNRNDIYLMPIIETALGVMKAFEIATASKRNVALALGLEDYTADLGVQRTQQARESFFARTAVVNAARAAGLQPIDSVFSDVGDMEALKSTVLESKSLGFVGMGCIHPRQVPVVNEYYSPDNTEIEKAKKIVLAFEQAKKQGLGVVALGSKMIDPPVVHRALKTIQLAVDTGKINSNWRVENEQ
ncbi:MAG: citrate lyase ACP [Bacteroidota bacterium]|nr:MAG: citrate lyase ACP [Bacteroidota bacterium]